MFFEKILNIDFIYFHEILFKVISILELTTKFIIYYSNY